jgi:hypothetical protein
MVDMFFCCWSRWNSSLVALGGTLGEPFVNSKDWFAASISDDSNMSKTDKPSVAYLMRDLSPNTSLELKKLLARRKWSYLPIWHCL